MEGGWKQQVMLRRGVKGDGGLVKVFYRWFEISLADESGPQGPTQSSQSNNHAEWAGDATTADIPARKGGVYKLAKLL